MYGFISRNLNKGLVYQGDISAIDSCIDQDDSILFHKHNPNLSEIQLSVYGKTITHKLPVTLHPNEQTDPLTNEPVPKLSDITLEFFDYLAEQASTKNISDTVFGVREVLFNNYRLYSDKARKYYRLSPFTEQSIKSTPTKDTDVTATSSDPDDIKTSKTTTLTTPGNIIKRKEYLDGYMMHKDYSIAINGTEQELTLKQDYEFEIPGHPNSPFKVKDNYSVGLRRAMFGEIAKAYDRSLLQERQRDIIKRMGHITVFTGVRRIGKSFVLSFIALREMMKQSLSLKNNFRPTTVLFLGLSEKSLQPVLHYMKQMIQKLGPIGEQMFHYDSKFNILSFRETSKTSGSKSTLKHKVLGQIVFLSCEGSNPGVGHFADCIIIDEGAKVPDHVYEGIEPIITHEGAKLITCSTTYKGTKKGWFYNLLTSNSRSNTEIFPLNRVDETILSWTPKTYPKYRIGVRYTIDDAELIPEGEKEYIKKLYSKDPEKYLSELYGRFPDEGKVFKYEPHIASVDKVEEDKYKMIVIANDPALTNDLSATIAIGYNEYTNKFCILSEKELTKTGKYESQIEELKIYKKSLQSRYKISSFFSAFDGSQKGIPELFDMNGYPVDYKIAYSGGENITKSKQIQNEYKVPKKYLVETTQMLLDNDKIQISNSCVKLIKELDGFFEVGKNKYEGVDSTDDFVNAMMIGIMFFYDYMNLKYSVSKPEVKQVSDGKPTLKDVKDKINKDILYKEEEKRRNENLSYFSKYVY